MSSTEDRGLSGERLIAEFFDSEFSSIFSFPNPNSKLSRTKTRIEIADVLVWMNRVALLIQVKTRDESQGTIPTEDWARLRITEACEQLIESYVHIRNGEKINLSNKYYHTALDNVNLTVIGIIVLVHKESVELRPSDHKSDIYDQEIPIHVFSWSDLTGMTGEIDTVPDLCYYLTDRQKFLKLQDIPIGRELDALALYKLGENTFPESPVDFGQLDYWQEYQSKMFKQIEQRKAHNALGDIVDFISASFTDMRKLHDGLPIGLYFAWELASLTRRERAYLGQKLDGVQGWFENDNRSRRFAWHNPHTGNCIVFYFLRGSEDEVKENTDRQVTLKLIQLVEDEGFTWTVYGLGYEISLIIPVRMLGLKYAGFITADWIRGKYGPQDVEIARRMWGRGLQEIRIEEFPEANGST